MDPSSVIPWVLVLLIVIVWLGYAYGKKRSEAFQRYARQKGLSFSKRADINVENWFTDLQLFSDDAEKAIRNLISGNVEGAHVKIFDFRIKSEQGQSHTFNSQTVAAITSGKLDLPVFTMYPKNIISKFLKLPGNRDIDFPSRNRFTNIYGLRGDDVRAISTTFTDQIFSYFENHKGLTLEGNGDRLLIYRYRKLIKPDDIQFFFTEGLEILRLFE
jgi:hypothetical protein